MYTICTWIRKPLRPNAKAGQWGARFQKRRFFGTHHPGGADKLGGLSPTRHAYRDSTYASCFKHANAGDYSKIELNGDELDITKKGDSARDA